MMKKGKSFITLDPAKGLIFYYQDESGNLIELGYLSKEKLVEIANLLYQEDIKNEIPILENNAYVIVNYGETVPTAPYQNVKLGITTKIPLAGKIYKEVFNEEEFRKLTQKLFEVSKDEIEKIKQVLYLANTKKESNEEVVKRSNDNTYLDFELEEDFLGTESNFEPK